MKILDTCRGRRAARLLAAALLALSSSVPLSAHAAIVGRAPGLAYDSTLDVTWATDAQLFDTLAAAMGGRLALAQAIHHSHSRVVNLPNQYSAPLFVPGLQGLHPAYDLFEAESGGDGTLVPYPDFALGVPQHQPVQFNWFAARAFVSYLNGIHYLGHDDWRLPKMLDGGCVIGVNANSNSCDGGPWNEVQSLYRSLGQQEGIPLSFQSGHNEAYALFAGRPGDKSYWLSDEMERVVRVTDQQGTVLGITFEAGNFASALLATDSLSAGSVDGDSAALDKRFNFAGVMILRDGDSVPDSDQIGGNPVPLPGPTGLLASALLSLLAIRRRRAAAA